MKRTVNLFLLIASIFAMTTCKKDSSNPSPSPSPPTNNNPSNLKAGKYAATGTITLTANGVNYTIPMENVQIILTMTNQILINAQDTTLAGFNTPYIIMEVNSPSATLTTGTYSIPGNTTDAYTQITYGLKLSYWNAIASVSGTSGTINITTLTSTTIKGTFSATVLPMTNASGTVVITNGVINCTY